MMHARRPGAGAPNARNGFALTGFLGAIAALVVVTALTTAWWINRTIYAKPFEPTRLDEGEQGALREKLAALGDREGGRPAAPPRPEGEIPEPRRYEEDDARREIRLTERELNALLATSDPTIGRRMAIDLADDLASVNLLVPLDPTFPILGGKTLRFDIGVELGFAAGKPVVAMRGVSLGGVPIPSAWWGDIKNQNLMDRFGGRGGFWDRFARGVENIQVRDSQLWVQLKE